MDRKQLIKKYIDFFKRHGHKEIRNARLIPENDPTVLFTTAGMHPLVPFLLGEKHPQGKRLVNVQKCIRTGDIEEVGDTCHHTFFEMLGNWSLGDYFKKEAIEMSFEFLTGVLKLKKERLAVSIFSGDERARRDVKVANVWKGLGIPEKRIAFIDSNWWGPAGKTGPCGPDTEMFYWMLNNKKVPEIFDPNDSTLASDGDKWFEIWNDVFMEYNKTARGKFEELKQKNVDTGMGVERTIAVLNNLEDNYLAGMWKPIIKKIEKLSRKKYKGNERAMRIIADHIKAACFILNEGVIPGNTEQGYVLRRLIRRAVRFAKKLGVDSVVEIAEPVFEIYDDYKLNKKMIKREVKKEEERFLRTLEKGLNIFKRMSKKCGKKLCGRDCFLLYQSYGFPVEMTKELCEERGVKVDEKGFAKEAEKHQKLSRTATAGKFKSGLADDSEQVRKLHTATHLLNAALREVLKKPDLYQRGSNITAERLRFDFNFDRKLTDGEIKKVEDWVNGKIKKKIPVVCDVMSVNGAKKKGAQGIFESKYGEKVKVYSVGNISKEICAGPHVENTSELGKFKIVKEESSAAGVRRIKAVLGG